VLSFLPPQEFFDQSTATKTQLAADYVAAQKTLDAALLPALSADLKVCTGWG
jgi:hypothetical protein